MAIEFVRNPSFPSNKCFYDGTNKLWRVQVREWACALLDVLNLSKPALAAATPPGIVRIKWVSEHNGGKETVKFYGDNEGGTDLYMYEDNMLTVPVDSVKISIQIVRRAAAKPAGISLTTLAGSTFAVNSKDVDARAYQMDNTSVFDTYAKLFTDVHGADHVVLCSHGGVPTASDQSDPRKIGMFLDGFRAGRLPLDLSNCEEIFGRLKGRVNENCVIWLGGCNIGANTEFCKKAAMASGCPVVAPEMALLAKQYALHLVDMLDRFCQPKVMGADGNFIKLNDFCAHQDTRKFRVPV